MKLLKYIVVILVMFTIFFVYTLPKTENTSFEGFIYKDGIKQDRLVSCNLKITTQKTVLGKSISNINITIDKEIIPDVKVFDGVLPLSLKEGRLVEAGSFTPKDSIENTVERSDDYIVYDLSFINVSDDVSLNGHHRIGEIYFNQVDEYYIIQLSDLTLVSGSQDLSNTILSSEDMGKEFSFKSIYKN